jgi:hypothetical protein
MKDAGLNPQDTLGTTVWLSENRNMWMVAFSARARPNTQVAATVDATREHELRVFLLMDSRDEAEAEARRQLNHIGWAIVGVLESCEVVVTDQSTELLKHAFEVARSDGIFVAAAPKTESAIFEQLLQLGCETLSRVLDLVLEQVSQKLSLERHIEKSHARHFLEEKRVKFAVVLLAADRPIPKVRAFLEGQDWNSAEEIAFVLRAMPSSIEDALNAVKTPPGAGRIDGFFRRILKSKGPRQLATELQWSEEWAEKNGGTWGASRARSRRAVLTDSHARLCPGCGLPALVSRHGASSDRFAGLHRYSCPFCNRSGEFIDHSSELPWGS